MTPVQIAQFDNFINQVAKATGQEALCEAIKHAAVCLEANAGQARRKTYKVIEQICKNPKLHDLVYNDDGTPFLTAKGNQQTLLEYIEYLIRNRFFHDGVSDIKFEPGVARIAFGELNIGCANEQPKKINILARIIRLISGSNSPEYDPDLNGMTFNELSTRFSGEIAKISDTNKRRLKNNIYNQSKYTIKWIPDFKTAAEYSKYTDFGPQEHWCITHKQDQWDMYTGQHNENKVYFCYVPDFDKVQRNVGENTPLDEYGLSLISIIVTPDESLRAVSCRWNHANGGTDYVMDEDKLSELLGGYIFDLCPPYDKNTLSEHGHFTKDNISELISNGYAAQIAAHGTQITPNGYPFQIFSILDDGQYNLLQLNNDGTGNLLSPEWFDKWYYWGETVGDSTIMRNGKLHWGCICQANQKFNVLLSDHQQLLSDKWFDWIDMPTNQYFPVTIDQRHNFINGDGHLLLSQWVDDDRIYRVQAYPPIYSIQSNDGQRISITWDEDGLRVVKPSLI